MKVVEREIAGHRLRSLIVRLYTTLCVEEIRERERKRESFIRNSP